MRFEVEGPAGSSSAELANAKRYNASIEWKIKISCRPERRQELPRQDVGCSISRAEMKKSFSSEFSRSFAETRAHVRLSNHLRLVIARIEKQILENIYLRDMKLVSAETNFISENAMHTEEKILELTPIRGIRSSFARNVKSILHTEINLIFHTSIIKYLS